MKRFLLASTLLMAGCGSLVDGTYRGEPLFTISGQVYADELDDDTDIGVALLWSWGQGGLETSSQQVVVETAFPARYEIKVYSAPDVAQLTEFLGQDDVLAAVGDIVIFEDHNQDGEWQPLEEGLVGGSFDSSILWIEPDDRRDFLSDYDADAEYESALLESENLRNLPGFNLVYREAPFSCEAPWEQWLEIATDRKADLEVGYYFPSLFDWNCDGIGDEPAPINESCSVEEELGQCQFLEEVLASFNAGQDEVLVQELAIALDEDPFFGACVEGGCPELVDTLYDAAEAAGSPPF